MPNKTPVRKNVRELSKYALGDLVLAKCGDFPYWPAEIRKCPFASQYLKWRREEENLLWCEFIGDDSGAWVSIQYVKPFEPHIARRWQCRKAPYYTSQPKAIEKAVVLYQRREQRPAGVPNTPPPEPIGPEPDEVPELSDEAPAEEVAQSDFEDDSEFEDDETNDNADHGSDLDDGENSDTSTVERGGGARGRGKGRGRGRGRRRGRGATSVTTRGRGASSIMGRGRGRGRGHGGRGRGRPRASDVDMEDRESQAEVRGSATASASECVRRSGRKAKPPLRFGDGGGGDSEGGGVDDEELLSDTQRPPQPEIDTESDDSERSKSLASEAHVKERESLRDEIKSNFAAYVECIPKERRAGIGILPTVNNVSLRTVYHMQLARFNPPTEKNQVLTHMPTRKRPGKLPSTRERSSNSARGRGHNATTINLVSDDDEDDVGKEGGTPPTVAVSPGQKRKHAQVEQNNTNVLDESDGVMEKKSRLTNSDEKDGDASLKKVQAELEKLKSKGVNRSRAAKWGSVEVAAALAAYLLEYGRARAGLYDALRAALEDVFQPNVITGDYFIYADDEHKKVDVQLASDAIKKTILDHPVLVNSLCLRVPSFFCKSRELIGNQ